MNDNFNDFTVLTYIWCTVLWRLLS